MSYQSEVLVDSPIRYFRLGESSGTAAIDAGSGAVSGSYVGGVTLAAAGAVSGNTAVDLNGTSGQITIGDVPLDGLTAFSLECWLYPETGGGFRTIFSKYDNDTNRIEISLGSTGVYGVDLGLVVSVNNGAGSSVFTGTALAANAWNYVVLAYNGAGATNADRLKIYVNAEEKAITYGDAQPGVAPSLAVTQTYIGSRGSALWFDGRVDEVAVYTTALSPARITAHYNASMAAGGTPDGVPPTISSAVITQEGKEITLTFSESMGTATTAGWAFLVGGEYIGISAISGTGNTRLFKLASMRYFHAGQAVSYTYDATSGTTVDLSGTPLATASGVVTNTSIIGAPVRSIMGGKIIASFHWGLNTYSQNNGLEHGNGTQNANDFNPTALDFAQWMAVAKSIGAQAVLWTVVHHEGFCFWSTAATSSAGYRVADTAWGAANPSRVDLVAEFCNAARAAGLEVMLYYSILDRRGYSGGDKTAHTVTRITELLTNYGKIRALATDGWGWAAGEGVSYSAPNHATVRAAMTACQPDCVLAENHIVPYNNPTSLTYTDMLPYEHFFWPGHPIVDVKLPGIYWRTVLGLSNPNNFVRESGDGYGAVAGEIWFYHPPGTFGRQALPTPSEFAAEAVTCFARNTVFSPNFSPDRTGLVPKEQAVWAAQLGAELADRGVVANYPILAGGNTNPLIPGFIAG